MTEQPAAQLVVTAPGVVITQEVMYAEIRSTHDAVLKLTAEVEKIGDHELRLRAVERRVWRASGLAGGAGAVLGTLGGTLAAWLLGGG